MEEPLKTSGSDSTTSTRGTTNKLPAENQSTTTSNDAQPTTPYTVESLQLVVIEGFQVGRGVARIDGHYLAYSTQVAHTCNCTPFWLPTQR